MKGAKRYMALLLSGVLLCGAGLGGCAKTPSQPQQPEQPALITETEAYAALAADAFKKEMRVKTDIGLSDPSAVGVDPAAFAKVADQLPADTEFAHIFNATDYGIRSDAADNLAGFDALLAALRQADGYKKVVFPSGEVNVSSTVLFDGIEDLWLVGEDTVWMMTAWDTAIEVASCRNFHLYGISFDYRHSPSVAGTVTAAEGNTVTFAAYEDYDLSYAAYSAPFAYGSYIEYLADGEGAYYPDPAGNLLYNSTGDGFINIDSVQTDPAGGTITVRFANGLGSLPEKGTPVSLAFTMYEHTGIWFHDSENIFLEGVNIYAAPGMGVTFDRNRNVALNRTCVRLPEGKRRLMTATADGFHFKGTSGTLSITGCLVENTHDDAINICSFYKTVAAYSMISKELSLTIDNSDRNYDIFAGDKLDFYDPQTLERVATATVASAQKTGPMTYEVVLEERLTQNIVGLLVGNDTQTAQVTLENCIFRNKRNRGVLLQTRRSVIRNCAFINVLHGAVLLPATRDVFGEAIVPEDITVENNKFINNGGDVSALSWGSSGQTARGGMKRIALRNNAFMHCPATSVTFNGVGSGIVENNLFLDPYNYEWRQPYQYASVEIRNTDGISLTGNRLYLASPLQVGSTVQTFVLLYNAQGDTVALSGNSVFNAEEGE